MKRGSRSPGAFLVEKLLSEVVVISEIVGTENKEREIKENWEDAGGESP